MKATNKVQSLLEELYNRSRDLLQTATLYERKERGECGNFAKEMRLSYEGRAAGIVEAMQTTKEYLGEE